MSVEITVCICYNNRRSGGGEMLTALRTYPIAPTPGDYIEILPARYDEDGVERVSAWNEPVARRYLHVTYTPAIEVHIEMPRRELDADHERELRAYGYS